MTVLVVAVVLPLPIFCVLMLLLAKDVLVFCSLLPAKEDGRGLLLLLLLEEDATIIFLFVPVVVDFFTTVDGIPLDDDIVMLSGSDCACQ